MTIIEQIKTEIERRLKDYWRICFHDVKAYNEDSNVRELKELLSFLSNLESEKPMNQDEELNEEIKRFAAEYDCERSEDILLIAIVARHFAEWGAEHLKK